MEDKDLEVLFSDFIATYNDVEDIDKAKSYFPELNDFDTQILGDFIATYKDTDDVNKSLSYFEEFSDLPNNEDKEDLVAYIKPGQGLEEVETKVKTEPVVDNTELIKKKEYEFSKGIFKKAEIEALEKYEKTGIVDVDLLPKETEEVGFLEDKLATLTKGVSNTVKTFGQFGVATALNAVDIFYDFPEAKNEEQKIKQLEAIKGVLEYQFNIKSTESFVESLEDNIKKYETESITDDILQGNYAQAAERALSGMLESAPSLALASLGPGGLLVLGASSAGGKFDEEFKKNPEEGLNTLFFNSILTGAADASFELVTRGILGRAGGLIKSGNKQAAEELIESYSKNLFKRFAADPLKEKASESGTEFAIDLIDLATLQSAGELSDVFEKDFYIKNWKKWTDAGIIGYGTGLGVVSTGALLSNKKSVRNAAEYTLTPESDKKILNDASININNLNDQIRKSNNDQDIQTLEKEISNQEQVILNTKKKVSEELNMMSSDELKTYASNIDEISKIKKRANSKSPFVKEASMQELSDLQLENEALIRESVDRRLDENIKTVGVEDLGRTVNDYDSKEEYQKAYDNTEVGKKNSMNVTSSDGFIDTEGDIYINKEIAQKVRNVNVAAHELLHGILNNNIKEPAQLRKLVDEFKAVLPRETADLIQKRIDDNYRFETNEKGEKIELPESEYMEEYFTAFADLIGNKKLKFNENIFTKIGDKITPIFKGKGYGHIKFETGQDVYNFIKDYQKQIAKGELATETIEAAKKTEQKDELAFSKKLTPEQTTKVEQDISDLKQEVKENEELAKKYNKEPIPNAKQQRLETSIKEQIKPTVNAFVESQTKRLFDPITVEARNNVSRNEFMNSMTSDIQTMVLNEFDATKQGIEKFITNRGYLRANSLAERLGIESKEVGIKKDVTEQKGLTTSETIDEFSTSEVKLPTRSTFRRKINRSRGRKGLTQEEVDSFKKIATEISKTLPPVEDKKFRNKVDKLSGPKLKKFVKDNIFKGEKYNEFIKDNYDLIKDLDLKYLIELDKGLMKQGKERAFTKPVRRLTSQEDIRKYKDSNKVYVENEAQGVMLYDILDPGADFVVDFYTNQTPQNVSNRKGKLAEAFGKKMFKDALPEIKVKQEAPIQERAKAAEKIQRDPSLKFSVTNKKVSEQYQNIAQAKDINKAMSSIDVENVTITNKNRAQKLINNLNFIIKGKIGSATFELAKLGNFGRDYEYGKITNGSFVKKSKLLGGKKYFKTIDGDYILSTNKRASLKYDGKDKITNWQPSRGSLFYGKTDPSYIKALEEAIKNDSEPINKKLKELKVKKVTVKDRITSSFIEANKSQSDANMNALELMSLNLQEAVHKYNMPIEDAALFLTSGYQATSGILKIAAPFKYVSKVFEYATIGKSNQKTGKKFREEHNPPASVVGASIILAIKNNQVEEVFPFIKNNYYQTQLSKADDALLDIANLDSTLPEGTSILDNPIKRLAAAGINLNTIINPLTNKNIAEENGYGVPEGFDNMPDLSADQNKAILSGENIDKKVLKNNTKFSKSRENSRVDNIENIKNSEVVLTENNMTNEDVINKASTLDEALAIARDPNAPVKKIRVFDFDDTLAQTKSIVFYTKPDGTEGQLTAEEFAEKGADLVAEGAVMDFSDFNIVRDGKRGPLFDIAKKIEKARGTEDVFVLTARAPESQQAIHEFLKSEGLNIPIENITGLGNSTGAAKANWIVNKAADGYNDFYFADDAYQNVEAVQDALSQLDVKSKVQQAKVKFSKTVNEDFNKIIEQTTGIASEKTYSKAKAKVRGAGKGNKKFFIPYSAEDFMGLIYPLLSKGKLGDSQMAWFKQNLLDPYARAVENLSTDRLQLMEDFKALKKALEVPKNLRKQNDTGFTNEQAIRVYLFNKMGYDTPGLSKTDLQDLIDVVNSDGLLKAFADQLMNLTKGDGYAKPGQSWLAGTITTDLIDVLNTVKRKKYLEQSGFLENAELIFSEENLNKLEAAYGEKYRESMENILKRMKSGKNRLFSGNRLSNRVLDYVNGSIGTIMFLNARSAVLQTISSINFINWSFNNPIKAGKAFANQKQYWKDFMDLMNSDYLMDRRNGLKLNISESEIADAASTSKNKAKAAINYILQKGFAPTQIADSFAIASGGATFYRNRINDLIKNEGLTEAEAKEKAMLEFRQIAETSQQSSDPSKISAQQSSDLGRVVLAFANTPMQYARLQKRAAQDLINGRGDAKSHVSKIIYYGVVQNIIFNALQQSLFALGFGDDEDEMTAKELEAHEKDKNKRYYKIANGMLDSQLRGLGVAGATTSVIKNFLLDIYERADRKRPEYVDAVYKLLQISPPISSKISKVRQAAYQFDSKKRREEVFEKGFSIDNPAYEAGAKVLSATTNIPLDRVYNKVNNIEAALAEDTETWQSVAMLAGWPEWQIKPDKKSIKSSSSSSKIKTRKMKTR